MFRNGVKQWKKFFTFSNRSRPISCTTTGFLFAKEISYFGIMVRHFFPAGFCLLLDPSFCAPLHYSGSSLAHSSWSFICFLISTDNFSGSKEPHYLFLFNDVLLITKPKVFSIHYHLIFFVHLRNSELQLEDIEGEDFEFRLITPKKVRNPSRFF